MARSRPCTGKGVSASIFFQPVTGTTFLFIPSIIEQCHRHRSRPGTLRVVGGTESRDVHALAPVIGYDKAAEIAKTACKERKTVRQVAREKSGLSEKQLDENFNLHALTELGIRGKGGE